MTKRSRSQQRSRRQIRVRKKVQGTAERPRLAVFRSNKHISVQLINDREGHTLAQASTLESDLRSGATSNADAAGEVGKRIAERAQSEGITKVVYDRGGNRYHGRVAALADAAREAGLEF